MKQVDFSFGCFLLNVKFVKYLNTIQYRSNMEDMNSKAGQRPKADLVKRSQTAIYENRLVLKTGFIIFMIKFTNF